MGDTLSTCYGPNENIEMSKEVLINDSSQQYNSILKQFIKDHPAMKKAVSSKSSYCSNVDKTVITIRNEDAYIGKIEPQGETHENIVLYHDGMIYQGEMRDFLKQGFGRLLSADGDCYEGKWMGNEPNGQGVYQGANPRRKCSGIWKQGKLEGAGKASYEDGSHYQGNFFKSMRDGSGTIRYADGSKYQGQFKNDTIQGKGILIGINHKYEGSWKKGKMDGFGKSCWYNDENEVIETYEGEYENGLKHGFGEYKWSNGRAYNGQWFEGEIKKPKQQKPK